MSNSLIASSLIVCCWVYDVSLINTFTQRRHFNLCRAAIVRVTSAKVFLTFLYYKRCVHQHSRVHRHKIEAQSESRLDTKRYRIVLLLIFFLFPFFFSTTEINLKFSHFALLSSLISTQLGTQQ